MSKEVAKTKGGSVQSMNKGSLTPSERFTQAVIKEFPNPGDQDLVLSKRQKNLIQNYFIKIDSILKENEVKRNSNKNNLEFNWNNVNIPKLALDVVAYSSIGLDPLIKNHISPIPYKNDRTQKYDINLMEGYSGLELKARKYGYEVPFDVIFELKYSTDRFKSFKKSINNKIESYEFEITDDFNRGELEGGFYYMMYDNPEKNKLVVMNRHQIEKRKPKYASAEFWGGEKDNWEYDPAKGKNVKNGKVDVEGWEEEMFLKTLKRHCWNSINIDSEKIDEHVMRLIENESQSNDRVVYEEIKSKSNREEIGFDDEPQYEEVEEEVKATPEEAFSFDDVSSQDANDMPSF